MDWKNFENKFPSKCRICGCALAPGSQVYGKKDDISGKWKIICTNCHEKEVRAEVYTEEKEKDDLAEALASGGFETVDILEQTGAKEPEPEVPPEAIEAGEYPLTLHNIKKFARWRL